MARVFISLTYWLSFLLGTPTNLLSLFHFSQSRHLTSSLLHSLMNLTDLVICFLVAPLPALTNLADLSHLSWQSICYLWYTLQMIAYRYSVFLIGVVSVLRTYSVIRPLALTPRRRYLAMFLSSYVVYLLGRFTLFLLNDLKPGYYHPMRMCLIVTTASATHIYVWMISDFVETLTPMTIMLISCTLTVLHLKRAGINHRSARKRKATVTVAILTVVYIVFNLPYTVDRVIVFAHRFSNGKISVYGYIYRKSPAIYHGLKSTFVSLQFMGAISSVINPIVIILRVNIISKLKNGYRSTRKSYMSSQAFQSRNLETRDL